MSIVCMVNHTAIGMEDANITNRSNLSKCHRQDDHDKEYQRKVYMLLVIIHYSSQNVFFLIKSKHTNPCRNPKAK